MRSPQVIQKATAMVILKRDKKMNYEVTFLTMNNILCRHGRPTLGNPKDIINPEINPEKRFKIQRGKCCPVDPF